MVSANKNNRIAQILYTNTTLQQTRLGNLGHNRDIEPAFVIGR